MNWLRKFFRRRDGAAAVEFAILLPVMLLILAGTTDLGLGVHSKLTLQSALNSALQYGMKSQGRDVDTVKAIVLNELAGRSVDVQAQAICECQSVEKACNLPCTQSKWTFLRVNVSEAHTSIFGARLQFEGRFQIHTGEGA